MSFQSSIQAVATLVARMASATGKVANFAYTAAALAADTIEGVEDFNASRQQNVPAADATDLNPSVLNFGLQGQGASMPRFALNHFFGRVSFNVNELVKQIGIILGLVESSSAHNANEYDASAGYLVGDVCYVITPGSTPPTITRYYRFSTSPTTLTGTAPPNATHWKVLDTAQTTQYDASGAAAAAQTAAVAAAKTYSDGLAGNYDAAGVAVTKANAAQAAAIAAAETYADSAIATAKAAAISTAESYADGVVGTVPSVVTSDLTASNFRTITAGLGLLTVTQTNPAGGTVTIEHYNGTTWDVIRTLPTPQNSVAYAVINSNGANWRVHTAADGLAHLDFEGLN